MARGGRRAGRSGAMYANRTDMQLGPRVPVQAAPGQVYGAAGAQRAAQQAVPLRAVASPGPAAAPGGPVSRQPALPPPPLDAPTDHPGEPLTAGSAFGPGPGPEALRPAPDMNVAALGVLNSLGENLSPTLRHLRNVLNAQGTNQAAP